MVRTDGDLFVVDLDVKPGKNGLNSLSALTGANGRLPRTRTVRTGSNGLHLYYQRPAGVRVPNSASKLGPGIDVRGDGGYVIGPGARHVSGELYTLEVDAPIAPSPRWLLDLVTRPVLRIVEAAEPEFPPASSEEIEAARNELDTLGPAVEGCGGDEHTMIAARILGNDFALTEEEAWPLLWEWNLECVPPWSDHDLAAKMRAALKPSGVRPYGCKRAINALSEALAEIAEWQRGPSDQATATTTPMVKRVREIVSRGVDPTMHGQILRELIGATGLKAKEIALPPAVDLAKRAEVKERRESFEAGDQLLIDSKDPLGISKRFLAAGADVDGHRALVRWQETFWRAMGTHYAERGGEEINADLYNFTDGKREVTSNAPLKPDRNLIETVAHALRAEALLDTKTAPAWISGTREHSPEEIIAFRNGLLHVPSRAFIPATRDFFNLNAVSFDYDAAAPAPATWLQFLAQLWGDDHESIATLQEFAGLALTGDTSFQKLFMLIGPKRSGKGTLARVLTELVGVENVTAPTLNGLGAHFGLESLISKTLAVISDARLGGRADLGAVVETCFASAVRTRSAFPASTAPTGPRSSARAS